MYKCNNLLEVPIEICIECKADIECILTKTHNKTEDPTKDTDPIDTTSPEIKIEWHVVPLNPEDIIGQSMLEDTDTAKMCQLNSWYQMLSILYMLLIYC